MMPEIEPQRETRASPRRPWLIVVGCVLWLGVVGALFAIKFREFVQVRDNARRPPSRALPAPVPDPRMAQPPAPRQVTLPQGPRPAELEAKARAGDAGAALQLAGLIERQQGPLKVAFEWRLHAAELGDAVAMAGVAHAYRSGVGVAHDPLLAESWTDRAVAAGGADEWGRIGRAFQFGITLPKDVAEASAWYRRAAGETRAFELNQLDKVPRVISQRRPQYPFALRRSGVGGEVLIDFLVDAQGGVQNAYVERSTEKGFEVAALEAVNAWRFEPGSQGGAPVLTHMQVPIFFTLNESAATAPAGSSVRKSP